ncbi:phage tail protein [Microbulbifer taiwanensis]|uniref:Phage tail protein n=1 Tax=Microbulbifer taiwanensis TaxID=986746 RepID=A0ABW1YN78_9GAMM|nr:phage tail protein [Microbulbifer taiwanensis]
MALEKLAGIRAHLESANLVASEQFASWMENGTLETASKNLGNGIRVCRQAYDAVIQIERYGADPALLFALVTTWLMEHDKERLDLQLPEPNIDVDVIDDQLADVEITIRFSESVDLVEEDSGPISYLGKRWAVAPVPVDEPNQVAVGDNKELPTDAPYVHES